MADEQKITAEQLRQWWNAVSGILSTRSQQDGNQLIQESIDKIVIVIEAQDARIKALEGPRIPVSVEQIDILATILRECETTGNEGGGDLMMKIYQIRDIINRYNALHKP